MRPVSLGGSVARAPLPRAEATTRPLWLPLAAVRGLAPALGLAGVFAAIRLLVALSPPLRETYYDEALTGLMSLAILRGVPQVFYWGQPYLGALDAYLTAGAFYVSGPSTLALQGGPARPCASDITGACWRPPPTTTALPACRGTARRGELRQGRRRLRLVQLVPGRARRPDRLVHGAAGHRAWTLPVAGGRVAAQHGAPTLPPDHGRPARRTAPSRSARSSSRPDLVRESRWRRAGPVPAR